MPVPSEAKPPEVAAPASDDVLDAFGPRVRDLRVMRNMSLRAFATALGVSPSAVSQIETGKNRPTMKRLHDIVRVLGISMDDVFAADGPPGTVGPPAVPLVPPTAVGPMAYVPAGAHPRMLLEDGIEWFQLSPAHLPQTEVLRTVYPPGARVSEQTEFVHHAGWELGYILSGRMRIQIAFSIRDVGPGDSICFDSAAPHKLSNPFEHPVEAIWIRGNQSSTAAFTAG